jgi:predicted SAM-dependent methyltransferase
MKVKQLLKRSDTIVGLVRDFKKISGRHHKTAILAARNRRLMDYLVSHETRKLQIGAGSSTLAGWLCTDIAPKSDEVVYLDATKPFPFDENTFNYVFSEHMIEHITWQEGSLMLRECYRILRPGGTIRIATPDLKILIGLYNHPKDPLSDSYIKWITDRFLIPKGIRVYKASFVINNAFSASWGHQFLYDGELLEMALQEAGFTSIKRCSPGESDDEHLRGIESHGRIATAEDMVAFETMVFEGKCLA